jgi:hypothetical protein
LWKKRVGEKVKQPPAKPKHPKQKMTKIAELKDRGAVVAWSPLSDYADVLAMGSKVRHFLVRSLRVDGEGRCVFAEAAGSLGETLQTLNETTHA